MVADFQPRLSNLDHRYGALEPMEGLHGPLWRLPRNDEFCIEAKRLQAAIHQGIPAWLAHHGQACLMAETCTPQLPQASTQPTYKKRHDRMKKDKKVEQLLLYFADKKRFQRKKPRGDSTDVIR